MKRLLSLLITMTLVLSFCTCATINVGAVDLNGVEEDLGPNIALGKPVTAPYQYSASFSLDKINDGKIGTSWAGYRTQKIGERFDEYDKVVVDLGMVYDLNCIVVRSRRDTNEPSYRRGWIVELASEPRPYKDSFVVGEKLSNGAFGEDLVIKFDKPTQGRYIIFYHKQKGIPVVAEIEAYGSVSTGKPIPSYQDTQASDYNAVELVSKLGIMEGISLSEFGVDYLIRRQEAAQLVAKVANLSVSEKGTSSFADVKSDNEFINYIEACLSAGVISKAENYRPGDFVRAAEFLKMVISALGYDFVIPRFGDSYPNNVLNLAAELELTKNVNIKETEYINRANITKILYNALLLPNTRITEFTGDASLYSAGPNLLKSTYGLELKKGIVTENEVTNLIEPISGREGVVKIDGVEYYDVNGKLYDKIGRSVMYLINEDREVFDAWQEKNRQTITTVYSKDILFDESSLDEIVVDLGSENGEESYSIVDNPYVLKNGVAYGDYTVDKLDVDSAKAELIDNNGDEIIDVINLWIPEVVILDKSVISTTGRITFFGKNGVNVDVSDYKHLSAKYDGKEIDISTILGGNLVYSYVSEDGKNVLFETVKSNVIGTLNNAEDDSITVEDKEYGISNYYIAKSDVAPRLTLGMKARFYFDEHNDLIWIGDVQFKKASDELGVTLVYEKPRALTNASIMIFNENSEMLTLNFADKVKIDGTFYTQAKLETLMTNDPDYLKGKMALYSTNNQGEISILDTEYYDASKEPGSNLKRMNVSISATGVKTKLGFYSGNKMLLPITKEFPMFCVPFSGSTPLVHEEYKRYYSVSTSTKQIPGGTKAALDEGFVFYNADDIGSPTLGLRKLTIEAVGDAQGVVELPAAASMIVDSISILNNADETQSYKIVGYDTKTGTKTELITNKELSNVIETCKIRSADSIDSSWYETDRLIVPTKLSEVVSAGYVTSILNLKKGDFVRYENDSDGKLKALERVFEHDMYVNTTNYKVAYTAGDQYSNVYSQCRLAFIELLEIKGDYMFINLGDGNTDLFNHTTLAGGLYICDNNKLTKVSPLEAALYADSSKGMVVFSGSQGIYYSAVMYMD